MKVVRSSPLRTGRLYPQEFYWYSFLEAESTPGHMLPSAASEKSPVTTLGIDPETLQLVAQCFNHCATPGPYVIKRQVRKFITYLISSWSKGLLEKPTGLQLLRKSPAFYGTQKFITAFIKARYLSLFWAKSVPPPQAWRIHFNIILPSTPESLMWKVYYVIY
jgi:hypothetical protein